MAAGSIIPAPIAGLPWRVIFILTALVGFGATVLYSAAGGSFQPWAGNHVLRFMVFLAMAIVMSRMRLDFWKSITFPVYVLLIVLLIGVMGMGFVGGGSRRWINLGFIALQPSELMKPAMILAAAWFFDRLPPGKINGIEALWPLAALLVVPSFLVIIQPDFDAALAYMFSVTVVAFLAGMPMIYFLSAAGAIVLLAPIVFFFGLRPYQQDRVLIFLNPENDPLGAGYHITQSKIAIGSGGIFGKGFGNGTQSHLDYLPEGHTDFIFATMAEEWGMVGGFFILFLYYLLMRWGMGVALQSRTRYGQLVAAGMTCTIFFYIMINLLMVVGFAPVAGLPLPFISHGGSSMLTMMICIGVIMSIERHPGPKRGQFT
jgi:rod shape determining protein RodA